jgi:hypothetical protein
MTTAAIPQAGGHRGPIELAWSPVEALFPLGSALLKIGSLGRPVAAHPGTIDGARSERGVVRGNSHRDLAETPWIQHTEAAPAGNSSAFGSGLVTRLRGGRLSFLCTERSLPRDCYARAFGCYAREPVCYAESPVLLCRWYAKPRQCQRPVHNKPQALRVLAPRAGHCDQSQSTCHPKRPVGVTPSRHLGARSLFAARGGE